MSLAPLVEARVDQAIHHGETIARVGLLSAIDLPAIGIKEIEIAATAIVRLASGSGISLAPLVEARVNGTLSNGETIARVGLRSAINFAAIGIKEIEVAATAIVRLASGRGISLAPLVEARINNALSDGETIARVGLRSAINLAAIGIKEIEVAATAIVRSASGRGISLAPLVEARVDQAIHHGETIARVGVLRAIDLRAIGIEELGIATTAIVGTAGGARVAGAGGLRTRVDEALDLGHASRARVHRAHDLTSGATIRTSDAVQCRRRADVLSATNGGAALADVGLEQRLVLGKGAHAHSLESVTA